MSRAAIWRFGDDLAPLTATVARGGILGFPTESSYGLGVDPRDAAAVERLFALKGREARRPLPVVIGERAQLAALGVDLNAEVLARCAHLWPAALSLVVPLRRPLAAVVGATTVAVRVPAHDGLRQLLCALGSPLTATSANASGAPPLCEPEGVAELLSGLDAMVVDGGVLAGGLPSTLVEVVSGEVRIVRPGRVDLADCLVSAGAAAER